jgi:hypothetical protein
LRMRGVIQDYCNCLLLKQFGSFNCYLKKLHCLYCY